MGEGIAFDREQLIAAFDEIGCAAHNNGTRLEVAIYGGSALMLASNFRFATEDVDIAEIERPWPEWLTQVVASVSRRNNWSEDWLNDAVQFHLSPLADRASDHLEYGTFPRGGPAGLCVLVPSAAYMLALKLKAMRTLDPVKGEQESSDIANLMKVLHIKSPDEAIAVLGRYFPKSAADATKQRFLLKNLRVGTKERVDAPVYGR